MGNNWNMKIRGGFGWIICLILVTWVDFLPLLLQSCRVSVRIRRHAVLRRLTGVWKKQTDSLDRRAGGGRRRTERQNISCSVWRRNGAGRAENTELWSESEQIVSAGCWWLIQFRVTNLKVVLKTLKQWRSQLMMMIFWFIFTAASWFTFLQN